jgi:SAM-dependent methyltransferase
MPYNELKPYLSNAHSHGFFHRHRTKFEDFYESERYFLTPNMVKPHMTVLDIGCASGGLGAALRTSVQPSVQYTGIDIDEKAIELGNKTFPDINLIHGKFPEDVPDTKYDMIVALNVFEQIPDWKDFLLHTVEYCNQFVNIGLVLRVSGPTVIDKDVSYGYYYDSGIRVHKIVHNIYELINFCCLEEMGAKKISFFGYHIDRPASAAADFRPLPQREQIRGNLLLELYEPGDNPKRVGGFPSEQVVKQLNLDFSAIIRPQIQIIIDKKPFEL